MHAGGCLAAAVLAAALLSGCAGGGGGGAGEETGGPDPVAAEANMTVLRNDLMAVYHKTVWANGTVAFQDTCNTGGCILDTSRAFRFTDITAELPAGGPVRVELELEHEPSAPSEFGLFGGFETWIQSADSVFYSYDVDYEAGHERVEAVLLPLGTVEVVLAAYSPGGGMPETPYSLRITLDADPESLPDGVPAALRLGPGATLEMTSADGGGSAFFLFGPDDALVGRFEGRHTLPADARAGDYVVLIPSAEPWATLRTDAGDAGMTALPLRFESGPDGTLPPNGAYDADWEVAGVPIGVGVAAFNAPGAAGLSPLASVGYSMRMEGPNGFALETGNLCGVCLTFGEYFVGWGSGLGDERVTAGAYAVHAETQGTYELHIVPFAVYFQRA